MVRWIHAKRYRRADLGRSGADQDLLPAETQKLEPRSLVIVLSAWRLVECTWQAY